MGDGDTVRDTVRLVSRRRRRRARAHAAAVGTGPHGRDRRDHGSRRTGVRGTRGDRRQGHRRHGRRQRHRPRDSRDGSAPMAPAGVVVADLDADGAAAVAAEIAGAGAPRSAVPTNVGVEAEVIGLVERAEATYGPIDLFCANAGIGVGRGPETPDDDWERIWRVNTMSHVYAARALLPGWLARGDGYFLATASAAGLLTQIGSAPVRGHQARGRRVRRVAVGDLRRRRHQGLVPVPAGRAHEHAEEQRRGRPRPGTRPPCERVARCSSPSRSPTPSSRRSRQRSSSSSPIPRSSPTGDARPTTTTDGCAGCDGFRPG